jgi:maleate cis-trans isomerase
LTNERLKEFLRHHGIKVTHLGTFDMLDMFDHAKILPEEIYAKVKASDSDEAEALFVACTQLRALEVLDLLERDLGKPVYSAVQATAWEAYAAMGVDPQITNCGSLLRKLSEPGALKARKAPEKKLKTA